MIRLCMARLDRSVLPFAPGLSQASRGKCGRDSGKASRAGPAEAPSRS